MAGIVSGIKQANEGILAATLLTTAISGAIAGIKALIARAREGGVDVAEYEVASAAFEAAIAASEAKNAEYERIRAEQEAALAAGETPAPPA